MSKKLILACAVLLVAGVSLATIAKEKSDCVKQCAGKECDAAQECSKGCTASDCSKATQCAATKCTKANECAATECAKAKECTAKECPAAQCASKQCAKECAAEKCTKACAEGKECTKACSAEDEAECKPKCPVSGKDADKAVAVDYKGGKVFLCCQGCPGAFKKDTAKYAAKANHQLVLTGQAKQSGCPFSGGKCDPETAIEVAGTKVSFCCNGCKGKATKVEGDAQVALLFGDKAFEKGFKVKEKKE